MALSQRLQQKLLQKLSPQQIQLMKLLQVPTASLEVRIKEELEINPALEEGPESEDGETSEETTDELDNTESDSEFDENGEPAEKERENDDFDISEFFTFLAKSQRVRVEWELRLILRLFWSPRYWAAFWPNGSSSRCCWAISSLVCWSARTLAA